MRLSLIDLITAAAASEMPERGRRTSGVHLKWGVATAASRRRARRTKNTRAQRPKQGRRPIYIALHAVAKWTSNRTAATAIVTWPTLRPLDRTTGTAPKHSGHVRKPARNSSRAIYIRPDFGQRRNKVTAITNRYVSKRRNRQNTFFPRQGAIVTFQNGQKCRRKRSNLQMNDHKIVPELHCRKKRSVSDSRTG